jgi:hypothetical protein
MKRKILSVTLAIAALVLTFPCFAQRNERVEGDGHSKSEDRSVSGSFSSIDNSGTFQVYVTQGSPVSVKVEADDNLLPYLITDVSGSTLNLHTKKNIDIATSDAIKVYVTMPEIEGLHTSGEGIFSGQNHFKVKDLDISISGKAKVDLDLDADQINSGISGSGEIDLKGSSQVTKYSISGRGDVKAFDLQTGSCEVHISGMGNAEINAKDKIDVSISGMGNIHYKGSPQVHQHVSGMGKISSE